MTGDVDIGVARELESIFSALADDDIVVDLAAVTFLDSSGITALVRALRRSRETGRSFALRSPSTSVAYVLQITRVDTVLTIEPSDYKNRGCRTTM